MTEDIADTILSSIDEVLKKVSSSLSPSIRQHIDSTEFDHEKDSFDFLDAKNGLLLSYLIDLTLFIKLKSTEMADNDQQMAQCLNRLLESKIALEKIRPLEKKMRYQLNKLLTTTVNPNTISDINDALTAEDDPLSHRPDIDAMLDKEYEDDGVSANDNDDDDASSNSNDSSSVSDSLAAAKVTSKEGIYKAPRLSATPFMEDKEKQAYKEERIAKRQKERMRKSELLSALKYTYGDAPEEDDFDGGARIGKQRESTQRFMVREEERNKFEEDAMVRLTVSRKDKKMRNKLMRDEISNLNSITDLGNLTTGVSDGFGSIKIQNEDRSASRHANGKRKRDSDLMKDSTKKSSGGRKATPKNAFQKALYGMESRSSKKGKNKSKK